MMKMVIESRKVSRSISTLLFLLTLCGCDIQEKAEDDARAGHKKEYSSYHATIDTILISSHPEKTLEYTKEHFNNLVDTHEEFFEEVPLNPDLAYDSRNGDVDFEGEAGQDQHYLLYAHFLKERNGKDKYVDERSNLNEIFSIINSIFQQLQNGGTYFGHLDLRIPAYSEYAVYQLSIKEDEGISLVDFSQQKELYIQTLRLLIEDRMTASHMTNESSNIARELELERKIDNLGELITNDFYLIRAREFQYLHYEI